MNKQNNHIGPDTKHSETEHSFFDLAEPAYDKSKEDVWEMMTAKLNEKPEVKTVHLKTRRYWLALAAGILLLAGSFSILRFYNITVYSPKGEHRTAQLPDGSIVELNAQSTLTYYPLWWSFSRELKLEGEAFFTVQKGNKFEVSSAKGKTIVVGTSFNIFSREEDYHVTCVSGKVKVVSNSRDEAILSPGYHAEVEEGGHIQVTKNYQTRKVVSWRKEMFTFTAAPLSFVIKEIERQYAVSITFDSPGAFYYTGYFSKEKPLNEVLDLVCKTFGLTFEKISDKHYRIIAN